MCKKDVRTDRACKSMCTGHMDLVQGVDAEVTHKSSVTISAREDGVNP